MSSEVEGGERDLKAEAKRRIAEAERRVDELRTNYIREHEKSKRLLALIETLAGLVTIACLAALASVGLAKLDWPRVWRAFEPSWAQVAGIVAIVATAVGLFRLRTYRPRYYAALEATVALTSGWMAFSAKTATESGLKLAAAVYLLVRSFDNWKREPAHKPR